MNKRRVKDQSECARTNDIVQKYKVREQSNLSNHMTPYHCSIETTCQCPNSSNIMLCRIQYIVHVHVYVHVVHCNIDVIMIQVHSHSVIQIYTFIITLYSCVYMLLSSLGVPGRHEPYLFPNPPPSLQLPEAQPCPVLLRDNEL